MKKLLLSSIVLMATLFSLTPARAQNILYWEDFAVGTDRMGAALAALPGNYHVVTATSDANFTALLGGGGFSIAILNIQNFPSSTYTSPAALGAFVTSGGKAIYADFSGNSAIAAPFGASYTGNNNQTTVTLTAGNLMPGVTNPFTLTNPGWITFSNGLAPLPGSSIAATFGTDNAIILNGARTAYVNGFLNDTFTTGSDGVALYTNEIGALNAVPEPTSLALGGLAVAATGFGYWRHRRRTMKALDCCGE